MSQNVARLHRGNMQPVEGGGAPASLRFHGQTRIVAKIYSKRLVATGCPLGSGKTMPEQHSRTDWRKHLAVVIGYGLGVWLVEHLNIPHFMLVCGLNMAVLLLTPYRYWPAMTAAQSLAQ